MELPVNRFRQALHARALQLGFWCSLASPAATEALALTGPDWLLIDTEHAPNELPDVCHHLRAVQAGGAAAIVRPAWNDPVLIKRILDAGAQSLIVPYVQDAAEAARAVAATRYPGRGGMRGVAGATRASGYGMIPDYLHRAGDQIAVVVQIETAAAVAALEEIMAVEGVDGIFVGPSDLSASLGHLGQPDHPEVQAVIDDIARRAAAAGCAAGILARSAEDARAAIARGYCFVSIGSDLGFLVAGAAARLRDLRG
ncbi:MAG: 4-hydroxy-2-oxo-heptane-1,7-dioate aldolase [Alphaproteobacteria bacterium]|nr:MAG: 4-hydroxy-2-oxo-heptane-1,7-dioate aldolase [Alphaproteobacteria bacterium]